MVRLVEKLPDKATKTKEEKEGRNLWFVYKVDDETVLSSEFLNDLIHELKKQGIRVREANIEPEWR